MPARGSTTEPIVDLISVTGPPWYDEDTGKELVRS